MGQCVQSVSKHTVDDRRTSAHPKLPSVCLAFAAYLTHTWPIFTEIRLLQALLIVLLYQRGLAAHADCSRT